MTTTLPSRGPDTGPVDAGLVDAGLVDTGPVVETALDDRGTRAAFVASLAVGLVSAGWDPQHAGPELLAAAGDDHRILDAASARLHGVIDPGTVVRAGRLLDEARRLAGPPAPPPAPTGLRVGGQRHGRRGGG